MKRYAMLPLAAVLLSITGAQASELAQINAVSCGSQPSKASRASIGTGGMYTPHQASSYGERVDPQFPSMVKLRMVYQHDGYAEIEHCGGTVIDSRYVVTAAHCVSAKDGTNWDRIELIAGDASLEGSGVIHRTAQEAVCHAGFTQYLDNDIALIKLSEPLPKEIVPAVIDDFRRPTVQPGGIAIAAGWPVTGPDAGLTTLTRTPLSVTKVEWPGFITVTSPYGAAEGVCQGESGGPLLSMGGGQPSIAGVLSGIEPGTQDHTGEPCMKPGYDMYYTPVAAYRDWIQDVMGLCSNNPDACRAGSKEKFFLSEAITSDWAVPARGRSSVAHFSN